MIARQGLANLDFEIDYLSSRLDKYQYAKRASQKELERLEAIILAVFDKTYPSDLKHRGGYRFRLEFKQACGAYQYLCPLSESYRRQLEKLSKAMGDIEACDRYASIRAPK